MFDQQPIAFHKSGCGHAGAYHRGNYSIYRPAIGLWIRQVCKGSRSISLISAPRMAYGAARQHGEKNPGNLLRISIG
jgi:hypothetical protein